ncbi:prolipoprotein diacylglyceryl transferase [candidate division Kazan bacterium RBG_13_50_9]|uniref:Phosphatidylglycerol--prolipoprotein diacylglyceryl transferase n=1 Tax=candidate division Kazan bacterium RBG_13_50_9 TaxID=1798535 RepID=A0A1F4NS31_UNCK3|nr:MAG: prolipoprotein diacylglyceryl transferase [candidate division Kazan bacterium RBG_13_50_9]
MNPVLLSWGGLTIYWYGLLMAIAVVAGTVWLAWRLRSTPFAGHTVNLAVVATIGGIVGARLVFVLLKWPEFSGGWLMILNLAGGGLSIHGALIVGALSLWLYMRWQKLPALKLFDEIVPAVVIGQIIGRFGNFFNQEAFGPPTNLPWKMFVGEIFRPVGLESAVYYHPTFLYSIVGLLALLVITGGLLMRKLPPGIILLVYIGAYCLLRFGIEFMRVDSDFWYGLTIAQWFSLLAIIFVVMIGLILRYKVRRFR